MTPEGLAPVDGTLISRPRLALQHEARCIQNVVDLLGLEKRLPFFSCAAVVSHLQPFCLERPQLWTDHPKGTSIAEFRISLEGEG